ncbi:MAG: hypothetical protein LBM77_13015, partial [Spirochaetaceae bacterium]|nr:hypothetical protein [Spirochaetaceae bacterium]
MKKYVLLLIILLAALSDIAAEDNKKIELKLDFPIFDLPYQIEAGRTIGSGFFGSYASMSMNQSMAIAMDTHSALHFGLGKLENILPWEEEIKDTVLIIGNILPVYLFEAFLPFGIGWAGSEFQRSVLSRFGVYSQTPYYTSKGYHISDSALGVFKTNNPVNFVRMLSARPEADTAFVERMQKNIFFYDMSDYSIISPLVSNFFVLSNVGIGLVASYFPSLFQSLTQNINRNEKSEIDRKIVYYPALNWVYDIFRPNEPYEARGIHPSGNGVNRYISWEKLTTEEKRYLEIQGWLSILNFASPLLYGFKSFPIYGNDIIGNFALHHYLTSFGFDVTANAYLKYDIFNMAFTLHNYINYQNYYFALEGELLDFPIRFTDRFGLLLTPR